jgi:antitoxin component YwqK of YwqJK toxin-antitoxin module
MQQTGYLINGKKNGVFLSFYRNGQLLSSVTFKNDLQDGLTTFYHENGQIEQKGEFFKNNPIKLWSFFDANGKLIKKQTMPKETNYEVFIASEK